MISGSLRALWVVLLCSGVAAPVHAQNIQPSKREAKHSAPPPLPLPRPSEFSPPTPSIAAAAPTAAQETSSVAPAPKNPIELRARIRSCATKWRSMKETGADLGMTWADFSEDCLAKN
jgi:hypothetical protein